MLSQDKMDISKVKGVANPANILTKYVNAAEVMKNGATVGARLVKRVDVGDARQERVKRRWADTNDDDLATYVNTWGSRK